MKWLTPFVICSVAALMSGCTWLRPPRTSVGQRLPRKGDEIMVCGQLFHTRAPVVLWTDPGGYDAYRTERRFAPWAMAAFAETAREATENKLSNRAGTAVDSPNRYGVRFAPAPKRPGAGARVAPGVRHHGPRPNEGGEKLTTSQFEQVRGGGWPLELLQEKVDQFVIHYDVSTTSRACFKILHDDRELSVHFMLDLDGTIYQTLDLKERAWQASDSNSRSIGIEICNIGAYPREQRATLDARYRRDESGKMRIVLPEKESHSLRTPGFVARPARDQVVIGEVQGAEYSMYDLTPQQYDSLIKLTATVCTVLPRISPDYPRDARGKLITGVLDDAQWENFHGLLGHYHVQGNKQDPGPAFQWDKVTDGVRALMRKPALPPGDTINGAQLESLRK